MVRMRTRTSSSGAHTKRMESRGGGGAQEGIRGIPINRCRSERCMNGGGPALSRTFPHPFPHPSCSSSPTLAEEVRLRTGGPPVHAALGMTAFKVYPLLLLLHLLTPFFWHEFWSSGVQTRVQIRHRAPRARVGVPPGPLWSSVLNPEDSLRAQTQDSQIAWGLPRALWGASHLVA